jgi:hypothetical protein
MNFNKSIISEGVLSLNTVSIFEEDALVSGMLMPRSKVLVDIEILLKLRFGAETEAELSIGRLQKC